MRKFNLIKEYNSIISNNNIINLISKINEYKGRQSYLLETKKDTLDKYFENAINNNVVLVAVLDDKIVGYLVGSLNTGYSYNKNIQAELDNMCILEEYRKMGIGKQLFLEFKKICQNNNISELKVVASYDNLNAIDFYKNNGFAPSEVVLKQNID